MLRCVGCALRSGRTIRCGPYLRQFHSEPVEPTPPVSEQPSSVDVASGNANAEAEVPSVQYKFFVSRSATNHLPVYNEWKSGGTRHQTIIRRVEGSAQSLLDMIRKELQLQGHVNPTTNSVILKGHVSGAIKAYLATKGF